MATDNSCMLTGSTPLHVCWQSWCCDASQMLLLELGSAVAGKASVCDTLQMLLLQLGCAIAGKHTLRA